MGPEQTELYQVCAYRIYVVGWIIDIPKCTEMRSEKNCAISSVWKQIKISLSLPVSSLLQTALQHISLWAIYF